jgi:hypothetical protein
MIQKMKELKIIKLEVTMSLISGNNYIAEKFF